MESEEELQILQKQEMEDVFTDENYTRRKRTKKKGANNILGISLIAVPDSPQRKGKSTPAHINLD